MRMGCALSALGRGVGSCAGVSENIGPALFRRPTRSPAPKVPSRPLPPVPSFRGPGRVFLDQADRLRMELRPNAVDHPRFRRDPIEIEFGSIGNFERYRLFMDLNMELVGTPVGQLDQSLHLLGRINIGPRRGISRRSTTGKGRIEVRRARGRPSG